MIYENEIHPPQVPHYTVTPEGAEIPIGKAEFPQPFHIGLQYASPARGHWTIAHSPMLIPQCHEIYAVPAVFMASSYRLMKSPMVPDGSPW